MSWPTVKLGEVADVKIGPFGSLLHKHDYLEGGVPLVNPMHIEGCRIVPDRRHAIAPGKASQLAGYRMTEGDVILARRGEMGRCAVVRASHEGFLCGTGSLIVRPGPSLSSMFLSLLLSSRDMVRNLERASLGTTMPNLNQTIVANIRFSLPPLPEQRRIAAILDHADALRAKRRQVITHLDDLARSIYADMVGERSWPKTPLADLCASPEDIKCGPFGTQLQKSEVVEEGVPLWGIKNVNAHFFLPAFEYLTAATAERLRQYSVTAGDIVMTRKGTVGNCAVYPSRFPDGVIHSDLLRVRVDPHRASAAFLAHQLHHDPRVDAQMARMNSGAVMPGINVGRLKGLEVINPPRELQDEFEQRMDEVAGTRQRCITHLDEIDALFASLQSRAFRGEL